MPKLSERKKLVKELDRVVSLFIRARDKECVICGSRERLQNGHLFTRTAYSTRWDITEDGNCHCQCATHNYIHEMDSYPFTKWYLNNFGEQAYDELHLRHKQVCKLKDYRLKEMIDNVKLKLKKLNEKI